MRIFMLKYRKIAVIRPGPIQRRKGFWVGHNREGLYQGWGLKPEFYGMGIRYRSFSLSRHKKINSRPFNEKSQENEML